MDLEESLRRYHSSPISELEFLKEIEKNAISFDSSMRERLSQLKARQQKQEMPANLSIIHALRATQEGFEDDGVMRNYDLLESQFKENLTQEDRELLKSPKPNLEKLQELKIRLLEKNAPKRKYEIPKPNEEVVSLANDLLEILSSQSPNDKRIRVLLEYLSVLERTPWDLESLLRDYNFVFSSTIGQHNKALERKETPYFDSVIVDETAKANPLELLMVMELAKECIILVGDDRQLPHYLDDEIGKKLEDESQDAQDEIEKALKDSMFKKLKERAQKLKELDGKECFITLNKQYRLAKKQEDNIYTNANGAKGEINKKGYLANALKDYDETLVEAFMRDFKERYKIEKLYYLLDDNIKNFEFAKIKHKISLYFKDAKFYPKSVALGLSSLFENKLKKNERLRYNGVDLVVKENHKSKTFNDCGLVLERQKSDDSKEALILQDSFIKKALKNFKRALGLEKEDFILYKECLPKLSMEVIEDGWFKSFEIIKDKTILGDKETLEIETPFIIPKGRESFALPLILNEEKIAYQGKITSKDFPLENDEEYKLTLTYDTGTEFNYVLEFKPVNNDLKPIVIEWQRIDRVELPTPDPIKKPSIDELKNDFNPNKGKSSDLFEWALEQLETLKDLNSPPRFVLERGIEFLEKKLECGGISRIRKDKNKELFYIVETNGKKVFCHSRQCKESANKDELSQGTRVCLEVFLDKNDPSKYRGKIYGLEKNREIVLLNTAKNNYQRKPLDEKIKHRIEALKRIKYPCLKIFSHYTLEELETLNPEFATPFKEHLRRLEEYYFDPQTDKDFKKEILDFFGRLNDSIPAKLQQEFINLPFELPSTDFLSRCLGSLEKDFQKTIFKKLKVTNPKTLSIVARASWINEKFLKNLMAQTDLEQQKDFLERIEECLKDPESFYFSSACELLLAFLSYRNAKRELELIPESEKTMRLLDSIDKAIEKETEIKSFVKLELKNQSFNNIPPLLSALRLYLRGDLEGVGIEIKGTEENTEENE
ncbi:AAA domain-containing protein [Helicobacter pylori]|uniref:AAA domain-containing protein n=1 Tax=Helicobacter pylori TaxID=210 RepID=UPI0035A91C7B